MYKIYLILILALFSCGTKNTTLKIELTNINKNQPLNTYQWNKYQLKNDTSLLDLSTQMSMTENVTTYLGVLEHFQAKQPDLLCVFRRKRGFFKKLWEKTTIPKS